MPTGLLQTMTKPVNLAKLELLPNEPNPDGKEYRTDEYGIWDEGNGDEDRCIDCGEFDYDCTCNEDSYDYEEEEEESNVTISYCTTPNCSMCRRGTYHFVQNTGSNNGWVIGSTTGITIQ